MLRKIDTVLRNINLWKSVSYVNFFVKICSKIVQSPMTSLCNNLILLFEFVLQRFMANIHIVLKI